MKTKIHPDFITTKVTCSGCSTTFDSMSTTAEMHVDVCSQCHPFYTGKQKLVDTAGRVDRFKAKAAAAQAQKAALAQKGKKALKRKETVEGATDSASEKTVAEPKAIQKPEQAPEQTEPK